MIDLVQAIVPRIEAALGCIIEVDQSILEEAEIRARLTIGHINIGQPNEVKQAGHYAFWIRKLKPLRVLDLAELKSAVDQLAAGGLVRGSIETAQAIVPPEQSTMFINELFAVISAIAIARTGGYHVAISKEAMHDLATTLRYHSFSPSALSSILWAHVK